MSHAQNEVLTGTARLISKARISCRDDKANRISLGMVLQFNGFDVVTAADVNEALMRISSQTFDALLTDLHMPNPGDGLTVASAMRHSHPNAATFIFSGYPEMSAATAAILLQTDQVLLKPMAPGPLVEIIRDRLKKGRIGSVNEIENVASILERESKTTSEHWCTCTEHESSFVTVHLDQSERCAHLPAVFRDLVIAFASLCPRHSCSNSADAAEHGRMRRRQGYTAAMWWRNPACCKSASFKPYRIIFKR